MATPTKATANFVLITSPSRSFLAQIAVHQFLDELDTFEIEQARVFLPVTVQNQTDLPWFGENLRVFDGRLIIHRVDVDRRVALHHMDGVAREVSGAVQP